jgi:chromosome partitioning protein
MLWDLDPQGGSSYFFNCQNQNNNSHSRLFDRYITIYEVIQSTDSYHIDVISNDAFLSDQFMNKASKMTALNFTNHDLVKIALSEVEDDYDVCIMDCSPGRFLLHDNIFSAADLLLIPNIPAPLSVYCNNMLMDSLRSNSAVREKTFSFYNMVQPHKNLHKYYLEHRKEEHLRMLDNFIPFYSEIELITHTKQSLFHQLKEFKASAYYEKLWMELCEKMRWPSLSKAKGIVVGFDQEQMTPEEEFPLQKSSSSWTGSPYNLWSILFAILHVAYFPCLLFTVILIHSLLKDRNISRLRHYAIILKIPLLTYVLLTADSCLERIWVSARENSFLKTPEPVIKVPFNYSRNVGRVSVKVARDKGWGAAEERGEVHRSFGWSPVFKGEDERNSIHERILTTENCINICE